MVCKTKPVSVVCSLQGFLFIRESVREIGVEIWFRVMVECNTIAEINRGSWFMEIRSVGLKRCKSFSFKDDLFFYKNNNQIINIIHNLQSSGATRQRKSCIYRNNNNPVNNVCLQFQTQAGQQKQFTCILFFLCEIILLQTKLINFRLRQHQLR